MSRQCFIIKRKFHVQFHVSNRMACLSQRRTFGTKDFQALCPTAGSDSLAGGSPVSLQLAAFPERLEASGSTAMWRIPLCPRGDTCRT